MKKFVTYGVSVLLFAAAAEASTVDIFPLFSSDAVLQRDKECPVWGSADAGADVAFSLKGKGADGSEFSTNIAAKADADGKWTVRIAPRPAGGSYVISAESGDASATSTNIVFGDVWICSGQSNMEMSYGWGLQNGKEDMETNSYDNVRLLNVPNRVSFSPVSGFNAVWSKCTPDAAKNFSACGYFFGTELFNGLGGDVPVGLVDVTWSGTIIETWLANDSISAINDEFKEKIEKRREELKEWENGGKDTYKVRMQEWETALNNIGTESDVKAFESAFDDSKWAEVSLPTTMELHITNNFDGVVWYRSEVSLTEEQAAAADQQISLGSIDDNDITYINGVKIGSMSVWTQARKYEIPEGTLKAGVNCIAVHTADFGGGGGFRDKPEDMYIKLGDEQISIAGKWKYSATSLADIPEKPKDLGAPVPNSFSTCYNGMMQQLFPAAVRGAIWYQGCSNVGGHDNYYKLFRAMISDWRSNFSGGDFPVYMVQLAAYMQTHSGPISSNWAAMRWTQMRLGEDMKNCGTAVAIDIGNHNDIHPKDKKTVGQRLARMALSRTYFKEITDAGPIPVAASAADPAASSVLVRFKNSKGLKSSNGEALKGFQLSCAGSKFEWVEATAGENGVSLVIPEKMRNAGELTVRYAWDDYPDCNLVNGEDLPCGPFEMKVKTNIVLENNAVSMVFDQSAGRIVSFSFIGGENVLWTDPLAAVRHVRSDHWMNWGGEKTWLWPMSTWIDVTGKRWPPRAEIESVESCAAEGLDEWRDETVHSFEAVSPVVPGFDVRIVKTAEINAGDDSSVVVTAKLDPASEIVAPWSIAQVPVGDGTFYVRTSGTAPDAVSGSTSFAAGRKIGDSGIVKFKRSGKTAEKSEFDADLLAVRRGEVLFALVNRSSAAASGQVYSTADDDKTGSSPYFELEFAASVSKEAPGLSVQWKLFKIAAADDDAKIAELLKNL